MSDIEDELGRKFLGQLEQRVDNETSGDETPGDPVVQALGAASRQVASRDVVTLFVGSIFALLLGLLAPMLLRLHASREV